MTIPASGTSGNASLFPSLISVSGITTNAITRATVQLSGFSHAFPDDVDIVLEAPDGTRSIVMSDAGGSSAIPPAASLNLTFSPVGTNTPPENAPLSAATSLRPANYRDGISAANETDTFSGAGNPGALRFAPADFDAFTGINPNGDWKLFVTDDANGDIGLIAGGWTLVLTVPSIFTVSKTADTDDGLCNSDCSLREAIAAAAALTGNNELIRFASPLFDSPQTIALTLGDLVATESVVIQGPGAAKLTISGNDASRILFANPGAAVSLTGMTLARGRAANFGGAIYAQGQLSLRQMTFERNFAPAQGGALQITDASANIVGCTFNDNWTGEFGGAIEFDHLAANGGVFLRVTNSTVSGNLARNQGGGGIGIFTNQANNTQVDLLNNTIVNNRAIRSGGIEFFSEAVASTIQVNLRNNIIANNSPSNIEMFQGNGSTITLTSQGFNLTNDIAAQAPYYNTAFGDQLGANPKLGPLNNNGGQVETHALLHGSNALDQGQASGYERDVRGVSRGNISVGTITPNSDFSDVGALEINDELVNTVADFGLGSLREAIISANANPDQSDIIFDSALFGVVPRTINLTSALPDITNNLSINGPSAKLLNMRRDSGGEYNVINSIANELAISGITISNGTGSNGGGITTRSRTSIAETSIENNTSNGIRLFGNSGTVKNSSIVNNTMAGIGAGIYYQSDLSTRLRIINSTISGNQATVESGAIAAYNVLSGTSSLELINSTIVNNSAPDTGGIYAYTQTGLTNSMAVLLKNTIVANNTLPNLTALSQAGPATITSLGFNLTNDNSTQFLNQSTDKINTNPQLAPLADNGGLTRTHAPLLTSPAIDTGSFGGNSDQIGNARGVDVLGVPNAVGGDGSDIGAVELPLLFRDGFE